MHPSHLRSVRASSKLSGTNFLLFVFGTLLYVPSPGGLILSCSSCLTLQVLTRIAILSLYRLTVVHNAQVFASPSNCVESFSSTTCTYYVCGTASHSACPNVSDTVYTSIGSAMTAAASTSPLGSESQFLLFGDLTQESYEIPRTLPRASFVGSGRGVNTNAIKCPKFESDETTQKLAFRGLTLSSDSACIVLASTVKLEASFVDVTLDGYVHLMGAPKSRIEFNDVKHSGSPGSSLDISVVDSYISFISSTINARTALKLRAGTVLYVNRVAWFHSVNVEFATSASATISQSLFTASSEFQFAITKQTPFVAPFGSTDRQLVFLNNNCSSAITLLGSALSADVHYNTFAGMKGLLSVALDKKDDSQMTIHTSPSLVLFAQCASNVSVLGNVFTEGTFYVDFPSADSDCGVLNPYIAPYTRITKNRFSTASSLRRNLCPQFSTGEETCEPLMPAVSTSAVGIAERANLPNQHAQLVVDLSENYWGTAHGPWVCCNPNDESASSGAFTTNFFNLSRWCLDEDCGQTSPKVLSLKCITTGCEANFSHFMLPVVVTFVLVTFFILLVTLIYTTMRLKLDFKTRLIQNQAQEDLVTQLTPRWLASLGTSAVGLLFNAIIIGAILITSSGVEVVPWQLKLRPSSIVAYLLLLVTAAVQIVLNLTLIASYMLRRAYPTAVRSLTRPFLASTVFLLCTTVFASLLWVPSEYLTKSSIQGGATRTLTNPSGTLTYLVYIPILINVLACLLVLGPTNLLHKLMHHIAYAKINRKMERELLKGLSAELNVENRMQFLRFVSIVPLVISLPVFILSFVGLVQPSVYYTSEFASLVPKSLLRTRMGLETAYAGIAVAASILSLVITWGRPRVSHVTSLAYTTLGCSFASLFGIYLWASTLVRNQLVQKVWAYVLIPLHASMLVALLLLMFALFSLRRVLLEHISNYDVSGLFAKLAPSSYGAINYPRADEGDYNPLPSNDGLAYSSDIL